MWQWSSVMYFSCVPLLKQAVYSPSLMLLFSLKSLRNKLIFLHCVLAGRNINSQGGKKKHLEANGHANICPAVGSWSVRSQSIKMEVFDKIVRTVTQTLFGRNRMFRNESEESECGKDWVALVLSALYWKPGTWFAAKKEVCYLETSWQAESWLAFINKPHVYSLRLLGWRLSNRLDHETC